MNVSAHVPEGGLEPPCLAALAPETSASAISPPGLRQQHLFLQQQKLFCAKSMFSDNREYRLVRDERKRY